MVEPPITNAYLFFRTKLNKPIQMIVRYLRKNQRGLSAIGSDGLQDKHRWFTEAKFLKT